MTNWPRSVGDPQSRLPPITRKREISLAEKFLFSPGSELRKFAWPIGAAQGTSYTVIALSWEMWAREEADLCDLLWHGKLRWRFLNTEIEIASLSYFQGSMAQLAEALTLAEQLTLADQIEESEYRSRKRLGSWNIQRGLFQYLQIPILIPANATGDLEVVLDPPFKARGYIRIGLHTHGTVQEVVPIELG